MAGTATGESIQYGTTTITGQATALLGNKYGDIFNIQQATFLLSSTSITDIGHGQSKVVRQNRVFPQERYTLETITTFDDGKVLSRRGTSQKTELRWERREDVGEGVFGEVHREESREGEKIKSRAVKVLRRRQLERMRIDYKKELDALIQLSQPEYVHRFVEFYSWYENETNIYLAMEFIPHGDLERYIKTGLNERDTRQIAYQVLDGIRIMHRLDLIHRDIKPANIFVVQQAPVWWVKIGDFSICKSTITKQTSLQTQVGTQGYQAPEVLGLVPTEKSNQYNSKCDIWSFGCLVYEMLTAQLPFPDTGALTRFCNDQSPFPAMLIKKAGATRMIAEFVWTMLQTEPQTRPTAEEAVFLLSWRCEANSPRDEQHLYFKDCMGRDFRVPWERCSNWDDMKSMIRSALSYIEHIRCQLWQDDYELLGPDNEIIDGQNWMLSVRPGMRLLMRLRPETTTHNFSQSGTALPATPNAEKENEHPLQRDSGRTVASESPLLDERSKAKATLTNIAETAEAGPTPLSVATSPDNKEHIVISTTDSKSLDVTVSGAYSAPIHHIAVADSSQASQANTSTIPPSEPSAAEIVSGRSSTLRKRLPSVSDPLEVVCLSGQTNNTSGVSKILLTSNNENYESAQNCKPVETSNCLSGAETIGVATVEREEDERQPINFTDFFGRSHNFEWQQYCSWEEMLLHVHGRFPAYLPIEPWIRRGYFDLSDANTGERIRPLHWEESTSQGGAIDMALWDIFPHGYKGIRPSHLELKDEQRSITWANPITADRYVGKPTRDLWAATNAPSLSTLLLQRMMLDSSDNVPPLKFTDCFAIQHEIPWSWCREWTTMKAYIDFVCAPIDDYFREPHIKLNHFDLYSRELKGTITQDQWEYLSWPGMQIDLLLWPRCERLLRVLSMRNLRTLSVFKAKANAELEAWWPEELLAHLDEHPSKKGENHGAQGDASGRVVYNAETPEGSLTQTNDMGSAQVKAPGGASKHVSLKDSKRKHKRPKEHTKTTQQRPSTMRVIFGVGT